MAWTEKDHTWLVCAYRESPFLEECIQSLREQTVRSRIQIATSTPNEHITGIAEKYGIPLFVRSGKPGIGTDWNFAAGTGETELLTIAHQDDVYEPAYTAEMLRAVNRAKEPILFAADYAELRDGEKVSANRLLRIKRLLVLPVRMFPLWKFARRVSLAFGCPFCCPSITYRKSILREQAFSTKFQCDLDWDMEERLSRRKGSFVYCPKPLMCHRIHAGSATTEQIGENRRTKEDYEIMCRFWPKGFAKRLSRIYASSEKSNQVKGTGKG